MQTTTHPTLATYAQRLAYLAPTSDDTADQGRTIAAAIDTAGGKTWAYFGATEIRVYDLSDTPKEAWNGVVQALGDELFAHEHGFPVEYNATATPSVLVTSIVAADYDTYEESDGIRAVFYSAHTHARLEATMPLTVAAALAEEVADALARRTPIQAFASDEYDEARRDGTLTHRNNRSTS